MTAGDIAHEYGVDVSRVRAALVHPVAVMLVMLRPLPCVEALEWVARQLDVTTLEQAWALCPRADWLVWLAGTVDEHLELDWAFLAIGYDLGLAHAEEYDAPDGCDTPWDVAMAAVEGKFADLEEHQEALARAADIVRERIPWSAIAPLLPGGAQ